MSRAFTFAHFSLGICSFSEKYPEQLEGRFPNQFAKELKQNTHDAGYVSVLSDVSRAPR